jgi:autotransporter-like protein
MTTGIVCFVSAPLAGVGYAHTSVGINSPGGNVDVNAGTIGMYATVFGNGFYLDTAVSGGPSGYTTRRTALQGTANGGDLNVLVAVGYDWKKGNLTIGQPASNMRTSVSAPLPRPVRWHP